MQGDTGLVEYSLVYEQIHVPGGNGLNTKSVRCARRKCSAMRNTRECMGTVVVMGSEYFDSVLLAITCCVAGDCWSN